MAAHNTDKPRLNSKPVVATTKTATSPPGGCCARSATRTRPDVHIQMAAQISMPLGLTTPLRNNVMGVAANNTPTSRNDRLDQATTVMTASASRVAPIRALTSRMR